MYMYMAPRRICALLLLLSLSGLKTVIAYKATVFIHGMLGKTQDEDSHVRNWIKQVHPNTPFYAIDLYNRLHSLTPMWTQVDKIRAEVVSIMKNHTEGVHLICFSQGGLICRGILSTTEHNVDTFIALSCPLAGQYGDTVYLKALFPNYIKKNLYKLLYTKAGQKLSIGNYWNDPHQVASYRAYSDFLAPLNNDTVSPHITEYKSHFLRLKQLVLIGGPNDGVITPWQSSQFAFYDSGEKVQGMEKQRFFIQDSFGLQTLYKQKKIKTYEISGVHHTLWHSNKTVFDTAILPWLT